ncbi:hypothetical protein [Streptomyces sp. CC208A]|uniref:hypothetical protein n=1 Tax=Streptomyces sp. CC208A TaxID=3044573 RepID=UPI0024A95FE8|nr:hypothetical protein [Streptomyces sp. CC208A]
MRPPAGPPRPGHLGPLLAVALLLGLTGCAPAVDPLERLGRKAVERIADGPSERPVRADRTATE